VAIGNGAGCFCQRGVVVQAVADKGKAGGGV
jgi:hypothetical protein